MKKLRHFFSIQKSKTVFWNEKYGVLRCHDRLSNAEKHGLTPLLVYGICVDGLPLSNVYYSPPNQPVAAQDFISLFWTTDFNLEQLAHIVGIPDTLVIDKRLNGVLHDSFLNWLNNTKVNYVYSESQDKTFTSKTRLFQEFPHIFPNLGAAPQINTDFLSIAKLNQEMLQRSHANTITLEKQHHVFISELLGRNAKSTIFTDYQQLDFDPNSSQLSIKTNNDINCEKLMLCTPDG